MDERSTDHSPNDNQRPGRKGRRIITALMVAGVLAAVPAGVALAGGGSGGSSSGDGHSSGAGNLPVQSTTPDQGQQDRGQGDRGDCPEKDGQSQQDPTQL
jgi:hypothetical protein